MTASTTAAFPSGPARDRSIDVMRGWCILMMIANHVAPLSAINRVSHSPLFVDGAQGFVFLSGYVLAIAHARRADKEGEKAARRRMASRALQLWRVHLLLVAVAAVGCFALAGTLAPLGMPADVAWPWVAIEWLTMRWQPPYLDILPLYVVLLLVAPLLSILWRRSGVGLVLALSLLLYVAAQGYPQVLEYRRATASGAYGLNMAAWQFLFVAGLCLGTIRSRHPHASPPRWFYLAATAVFVAFFLLAQTTRPALLAWCPLGEPLRAVLFDKSLLGPGRLLYFLSAVFVGHRVAGELLRHAAGRHALGWLEAMGKRSLYSYLFHFLWLAIVMSLGVRETGPWWAWDVALAAILALLVVMIRREVLFRLIPN